LNLDSIYLGSEKVEVDIISNEVKKSFPKTPKGKLRIETESNNNNLEHVNNLLNKKDYPKIKKRLNLISSLDNYQKEKYSTSLTESNNYNNDKEYLVKKKNDIKECISKKLNNGNNNKLRLIMEQTSTLFDNKLYELNFTGKKQIIFLFFNFFNILFLFSAKDNNRESYKFELIPKDYEKKGKLLSSEEIKLIFAKRG